MGKPHDDDNLLKKESEMSPSIFQRDAIVTFLIGKQLVVMFRSIISVYLGSCEREKDDKFRIVPIVYRE